MGGGDLQGSVQAFKSYRRLVGSFVEVHDDPNPKTVEMANRPPVVIPCGHFACDQELAAHDVLRQSSDDRQYAGADNVLQDFLLAQESFYVTVRLRSSFEFVQHDLLTVHDDRGIQFARCRIEDVSHVP